MIISISGRKNSGKDLVGEIIQYLTAKKVGMYDKPTKFISGSKARLPQSTSGEFAGRVVGTVTNWETVKWADTLKDITCLLIGCTREQLEDETFKNTPLGPEWDESHGINTPRELLQILGTECGREMIHPNIWVNALMSRYKPYFFTENLPNWIITDTRFPNELKATEGKGFSIRVNRTYYTEDGLYQIGYDPIEKPHISETALDNATFDYVIENKGTIEELIEKIRIILEKEKII